jgi:hypothetical protein
MGVAKQLKNKQNKIKNFEVAKPLSIVLEVVRPPTNMVEGVI